MDVFANWFQPQVKSRAQLAQKPQGAKLLDATGDEIDDQSPDGLAVPHVYTFASILRGGWYTYWHGRHDEAMRHSRENAMAMRRDPFIMSLLRERKEATLRNKWTLEPDNPKDPAQMAVAEGLTRIVKSIPYLKRLRRQMLERLWYGRYGSEIKWAWDTMDLPTANYSGPQSAPGADPMVPGQQVQPNPSPGVFARPQDVTMTKSRILTVKKHRPINGDKIGFHWDGTPYIFVNGGVEVPGAEKIYTNEAPAILLRGWWRKQFLIHTYDPDDADYYDAEGGAGIYGVGIRSRIYWAQWMKLEYFSWITDLFERVGLGVVQIKYDMSNAAAKTEAEKTAKNFSRRTCVLVPTSPDGANTAHGVEIVDAPIQGATFIMELVNYLDRHLERFIIGQSMSGGKTESNGDGFGGTGMSEFAAETKSDLIAADAEEEAEGLTGSKDEPGLLSVIKRWTFPDADFPVRWKPELREPDPRKKMEVIEKASGMGVKFIEREIRALTGMGEPMDGEPTVGGQMGDPFGGMLGPEGDKMGDKPGEEPFGKPEGVDDGDSV